MNKDDYRDKIMFRDAPPKSFGYARDHREQGTLAENVLWERLKNKQLQGLKWRHQHPFGGFILDFYCHSKQLSVELDGGYHFTEAQRQSDAARTEYIKSLGVRELRFLNEEVLHHIEEVLVKILAACAEESFPKNTQGT